MSSSEPTQSNRLDRWQDMWNDKNIPFHQLAVHKMLEKHLDKLIPGGKANKVFFPLCGKAVDMMWLADKGFIIVGLDGVKQALEEFFTEQSTEWTEEKVPKLGDKSTLLKSKDDRIRLYCGDIMAFSSDLEGTFDAVWDRGSLVALDRVDVPKYVKMMKSILSPGGCILLEVLEYDASSLKDTGVPPPHAMFVDELKKLYEPECTLEAVDRNEWKLEGKDIYFVIYLITKK